MSKILVEESLFDELLSKDLSWDKYSDLPKKLDKYFDDKEDFLSFIHEILASLCEFAGDWLNTVEGILLLGAVVQLTTSFFKNLEKSLSDLLYTYTDKLDKISEDAFVNGFKDASKMMELDLDSSFLQLANNNALKSVQQENFDQILNISNDLKQEIRKVLYDGIREGKSVDQIRNELLKLPLEKLQPSKFTLAQRAEMIAKTEYMRAYHRGCLHTYSQLGITHVRIRNNGNNICNYCIGLAKGGIYKIEDAIDLLPAHPRCKCTFEPVIPEDFTPNIDFNYSYIYNQ